MRKWTALLVLLVLAGGGGYYALTHGWNVPLVSSLFASSTDAATTAKVKSAFSLSKRLTGYSIGVKSEAGVVTLTGEVASDDAKSLAGEIASGTSGVKEVKNQINVNPGARPSAESSLVEDLEIKTSILEALNHSPELGGKRIEVKVDNQVVSLTGTVDTPAQRNGAEQIARSISGVAAVTNNLAVTNPQAATEPPTTNKPAADPNAELAKRVEFELYKTGGFDVQTMRIQAKDGMVTLGGTVRSRAEELLAVRVAESVDGAKKVTDELKISAK
jgi:hyperosmotically inducible protein